MQGNKFIKRLFFFWFYSYTIASAGYFLLWLVMPHHYVFGTTFRMFLYHWQFPLLYIAIPCFFYGIIATVFSELFQKTNSIGKIFLTFFIIALTILLSSPVGGMLYTYHDMRAGFFPSKWQEKLLIDGSDLGLQIGWYIILVSIPYNILGAIACYFLTKRGAKIV